MAQNDVLRTTDAEADSTAFISRFNEWKRVYAVSENARYLATATSTYGGSTQTLPLATSTLGTQSIFLRAKYLEFSSGSTGDWTLQTVVEDRTFIIRNRSDNDIILDTTDAGTITLTVPNTETYTVNLFASVPAFILTKAHILSSDVASTKPYAVASYQEGIPSADTLYTKVVLTRDWTVPTNFTNSQGHCETAVLDVGGYTVDIVFNSTTIGTITFSSGSTTASFASAGPFTFGAGDVIELIGSSVPDSVADNFSFTIFGSIG